MQVISPLFLLGMFIGTACVILLAFQGGVRFGRWRSQRPNAESAMPLRVLVTSILSLLAFILGFTFGLASSHFDDRSKAVFEEAVSIGAIYHRADFLPEEDRAQIQALLREYIDVRLEIIKPERAEPAVTQLRQLQHRMWAQAVVLGKKDAGPALEPTIQALNELLDVHSERVISGWRSRIPTNVWFILLGMTFIALATAGYQAGLAGTQKSIGAIAYAVVFAAVIVMIAAADVPRVEQVWTSHQPLVDLRARLNQP